MFVFIAQAHSSVERAGLLGGVQLRLITADKENRLRGDALEDAIKEDLAAGKIPFYVSLQWKLMPDERDIKKLNNLGRRYPWHNEFLRIRLFRRNRTSWKQI